MEKQSVFHEAMKKKVTDELRIPRDKVKTGGPGYAVGQSLYSRCEIEIRTIKR